MTAALPVHLKVGGVVALAVIVGSVTATPALVNLRWSLWQATQVWVSYRAPPWKSVDLSARPRNSEWQFRQAVPSTLSFLPETSAPVAGTRSLKAFIGRKGLPDLDAMTAMRWVLSASYLVPADASTLMTLAKVYVYVPSPLSFSAPAVAVAAAVVDADSVPALAVAFAAM